MWPTRVRGAGSGNSNVTTGVGPERGLKPEPKNKARHSTGSSTMEILVLWLVFQSEGGEDAAGDLG